MNRLLSQSFAGPLTFALLLGVALPVRGQEPPRRYALVAGVREYPVSNKLNELIYTEPDATAVTAALEKSGYDVTLMTQSAAREPGKARLAPNVGMIRKAFTDLATDPFLTNKDCLLVFLAGHGIQLQSKDGSRLAWYFCPADAEIDNLQYMEDVGERHHLLSVDELYDTLNKSKAGVKLLVIDACRNDPSKPGVFRTANSVTRPIVPAPPGGIFAMFSCSPDQMAIEDPALKHGVFTYFLIEALSGRGDTDGDRQIDVTELYKYVGVRVKDHVRKNFGGKVQFPDLKVSGQAFASLISLDKTTPEKKLPVAGEEWAANSLGMKFAWCPPGSFTMGSPAAEAGRKADENQVNVTLGEGFWMAKYEVTQSEWQRVMGRSFQDQFALRSTSLDKIAGEGPNHPIYFVSWKEADEFCRKLTELDLRAGQLETGWKYALPTEAQWEYACRAGTKTAFGAFPAGAQANVALPATVPVGQRQANAWNLYDMQGNVQEWCEDRHAAQLPGGTDPLFLGQSNYRVVRGAAWQHQPVMARIAHRTKMLPAARNSLLGFRVAKVRDVK